MKAIALILVLFLLATMVTANQSPIIKNIRISIDGVEVGPVLLYDTVDNILIKVYYSPIYTIGEELKKRIDKNGTSYDGSRDD